jgi:hypothetical protein
LAPEGIVWSRRAAASEPDPCEPLAEVDSWLSTYRRLWTDRFERLSERLASQQQKQKQEQETDHDRTDRDLATGTARTDLVP